MTTANDVEVLFTGSKIRIGKSKTSGYMYFQTTDTSMPSGVWYRFEPEYYTDYEEYMKEYCEYLKTDTIYPNLGYCKILDGETLEHYIALFNASEVYINHQCVYSNKCDVTYTKQKYVEDMTTHMIPNKYYPFINNINISMDDTTKDVTIHFSVTLRYEEL